MARPIIKAAKTTSTKKTGEPVNADRSAAAKRAWVTIRANRAAAAAALAAKTEPTTPAKGRKARKAKAA